MTCAEAQVLVQLELDREIDAVQSVAVNAHLAGCPACRSRFVSLSALLDVIRAKPERPEVSDALLRRLYASLPRPPRRLARWAPTMGAMAATAMVTVVVLQVGTRRPGPPFEDELVEAHLRSLQVDHLTDVASSDRHTVKPWFQGKLEYAFPVVDLAEQGFPLLGGRLDQLEHRPVGVLVYRRRQHTINVFVSQAEGAPRESLATERGFHVRGWSHAGLQYWAVSDVTPDDLQVLQKLMETPPG